MSVMIDITDTETHQEWIDICERVISDVDEIDGALIMSYRSEFYFDRGVVDGSSVSESIKRVLEENGYSDLRVSPAGYSHIENIKDHDKTKEIRVRNEITK